MDEAYIVTSTLSPILKLMRIELEIYIYIEIVKLRVLFPTLFESSKLNFGVKSYSCLLKDYHAK